MREQESQMRKFDADPVVVRRLRACSATIALLVSAVGLTVIVVGWGFDVRLATQLHPNWVSMKANTAICLALEGVALWLYGRSGQARRQGAAVPVLAGTATAIAALTLAQDVLGWNLGIDEMIFDDPYAHPNLPGRMASATAVGLVLIGCSLLTLTWRRRHRWIRVLGSSLALLASAEGLVMTVGYLYGAHQLYSMPGFGAVALHTALGILLLSVGVLTAHPEEGVGSLVSAGTTSGALVRRVLPAVIVIPVVLGWLQLRGERGLYPEVFGAALLVLANVVSLGALVWLVGRSMLGAELARLDDQKALAASERNLTTTLDSIGDGVIATDDQGVVVRLNPIAERLTGWSRAEALGRPLSEVFRVEADGTGETSDSEALGLVAPPTPRLLRSRAGACTPIADISAPMRGPTGNVLGAVLVIRDQTAIRLAEHAMRDRIRTIAEQQAAIRLLSTPVLRLRRRLLLVPLVGILDGERAEHLIEVLLPAVRAERARVVVVDLTGIAEVDRDVAVRLQHTVAAVRLLGAEVVFSGLAPAVASRLTECGLDLRDLRAVSDLETGVAEAERKTGRGPRPLPAPQPHSGTSP